MDLITIDGPRSRDLDDAIWVEAIPDGYRVSVAVSDVSSIVGAESAEDAAARAAGFTVYRASSVVRPMLPPEISEDAASLVAGKERPAVVVTATLDDDLAVVDVAVERRRVGVRGRYDHEGVLAAAASDAGVVGDMLRLALPLSEALQILRRDAGALTLHDSGTGLVMNEEGRVVDYGRVAKAHILVQEFMILANAALARRMAERGIRILYRNHRARVTANRRALMEDADLVAAGHLDAGVFESRRALVMGRAEIGTTVEGHFGLNLPVYAWFTSPIRRYADLVNHRILIADLEGAAPPFDGDELSAIAAELNGLYRHDNDDRSERYKKRAASVAVGEFVVSEPRAMSAAVMTQAIKAMAAGADLGPDAVEKVRQRSLKGDLTSKDLFRLLTNGGPSAAETRRIVVEHLDRNPCDSYGLFGHGQRTTGWKLQDGKVSVGKTADGAPAFVAEMLVTVRKKQYAGIGFSSSKKGAMQRAMSACLVRSSGLEPPGEWGGIPSDVSFGEVSEGPRPTPGSNDKGALISVCATRKWPGPVFETVQSGPSHAPKFACVVRVSAADRKVEVRGVGGSRKAAEAHAAAAALASIAAASAPA